MNQVEVQIIEEGDRIIVGPTEEVVRRRLIDEELDLIEASEDTDLAARVRRLELLLERRGSGDQCKP